MLFCTSERGKERETSMEIEYTSFNDADIDKCCMGAGVVPVAVHPDTREDLFLLGRERWVPTWKGSCRWSGFEGARKEDESVMLSAVREAHEETLGVLFRFDDLYARLQEKDYDIRIVLRILNDRRPEERYHVTYVVPVPFDRDLPETFRKTRGTIEYLDRVFQELRHTRPACFGPGEVGPVTVEEERVTVRVRDDETCVTVEDALERQKVETWNNLRARLEKSLIDHPCLVVERGERWGLVQDAHITSDYMEKDQVRWWSRTELQQIMNHRGFDCNERFRPYFLPVLQTLLRETEELKSNECADCDETPACEPSRSGREDAATPPEPPPRSAR